VIKKKIVYKKTKGLKQILTISQIYQTFINDTIYHTHASFFIKSKKNPTLIFPVLLLSLVIQARKKNKNNVFEMFSSRSFKTVINCLFNLYSKKWSCRPVFATTEIRKPSVNYYVTRTVMTPFMYYHHMGV